MVEDTKQFGEFNALQRRVLKEIHCFPWFVVSLMLLYGIFLKKHRFHPLFIVHGLPYRFLASVGLAQARPNKSSVTWLTVQTIFGEPVIFAVNLLWHG